MANTETINLNAPFTQDTILEVRTSKMKTMPGLTIQSGIDKTVRDGVVHVSELGIDEDEHDPTFHGGVDKALLGYCSSHYPGWRQEYPAAADRFQPGGFGENLVTRKMNERNVCIGDTMSVGDEVLLQVSLPRQPCFKLNHRFGLKNFAPVTYRTSRTGWYYRVLRGGAIKAGDEIKLVERPHPKWTIERVQEYLHRNDNDHAMNEELADVEELGIESRGAFRKRVDKELARRRRAARAGGEEAVRWRDYKIVDKKTESPRIKSFVLEAVQQEETTDQVVVGAHARIKLPNGLTRSYSIVSGDNNRFELGIALEENSRGGSRFFHDEADINTVVQVGRITTDIKVANMASNHVFIVGGIGITAFLAMMQGYHKIHYNYALHYAVRNSDDMPFKDRVEGFGDHVTLYLKTEAKRMDIDAIVAGLGWNAQLYVCGPPRMMEAARRAVADRGLDEEEVHFEAFQADTAGDPFEVEVRNRGGGGRGGAVFKVTEEETLLEVLRREFGDDVPSSCEVGNCGTCKVAVKNGRVDHRGSALTAEEKACEMLSCVSRGMGRIKIELY